MNTEKVSEWKLAADMLANCLATIECDCSVYPSESIWAQIVYRRCGDLIAAINEKRPDLKW